MYHVVPIETEVLGNAFAYPLVVADVLSVVKRGEEYVVCHFVFQNSAVVVRCYPVLFVETDRVEYNSLCETSQWTYLSDDDAGCRTCIVAFLAQKRVYSVPLGWASNTDMCRMANPLEGACTYDTTQKQTVEMRSPDGSADIYLLIVGLAVACRYGFEISNALDVAEKTYVNVNIHQNENAGRLAVLEQLPDSCAASADCLERQRAVFEGYGIFSPAMIDGILRRLRSYGDRTLRADIGDDKVQMLALVREYFHCG